MGVFDSWLFSDGRILGGDGMSTLSSPSSSSDEDETDFSFLRLDLVLINLCGDLAAGLMRFLFEFSAALDMSDVRLSFSHFEAAAV